MTPLDPATPGFGATVVTEPTEASLRDPDADASGVAHPTLTDLWKHGFPGMGEALSRVAQDETPVVLPSISPQLTGYPPKRA